jgi:Predicted membrane protein (DUF2207)
MRVRRLTRVSAALIAAGAVAGLALVSASGSAAAATSGEEQILSYDTHIFVQADGSFSVRETIDYDFGDQQKHGIYRYIPVVYPQDSQHNRVIKIRNLSVSSADAPAQTQTKTQDGNLVVRIGDPNQTVTGEHTYVITYNVVGAMNAFSDPNAGDQAELYWNAIGPDWTVPIDEATAEVEGPSKVLNANCYAGDPDSHLPCTAQLIADGVARYRQGALEPNQVFTVVAAFSATAVHVPAPVIVQKWSIQRAFSAAVVPLTVALIVLVLAFGLIGWAVYSRGRDRRYASQIPGLTPVDGASGVEAPAPLLHHDAVAVAFSPPKDVRPGEAGTLIDERADVLDVTATIIDLAVRRFLRIDEVPPENERRAPHDWTMTKLKDADDSMVRYERTLFESLFAGRDSVTLSALRQTFASDLSVVREQLYTDVVAAGWFRARPDQTRHLWEGLGIFVVLLGGGLTYLLARWTHFGLAGLAVVIGGLALTVAGRWMPSRTGKGSAAMAEINGFRLYLHTAEAGQIKVEEREDIFSRYLPYAIVFGEADRWAKTFASVAAAGAAAGAGVGGAAVGNYGFSSLYWYGGWGMWNFGNFNNSIDAFTVTTAGSMAAAAQSAASHGISGFGGGGFGGGGFGGGGGGSW